VSAARDVAVVEIAFGDASCVAFVFRFAAGRGEQSGGEARHWWCEMCRLRVMLLHAGETISAARRRIGTRGVASLMRRCWRDGGRF
jgi:hypothetical protein